MNTEQERVELLPCPFCGSTNIEIQISTPDREGVPTNLMCSDCGASGPWEYEQGNSHAKADDAWNRRAALQSQDSDDAERYRWLLGKFQQSYDGEDFETYHIKIYSRMSSQFKGERTVQTDITWRDKTDEPIGLSEAIDHARRIEGGSNADS